jgi:hypothetical protein
MLLKTKDRCGKIGNEAGKVQKTKIVIPLKQESA